MSEWDNREVARIKPEECVSCGKCRALCPFDAIELIEGRFKVIAERCEFCYVCIDMCPIGAIEEATFTGHNKK